jgi:hypothetical protein
MAKTGTFPNEMIHIMPRCVVHLHGHYNKMVPFMKPFILAILAMVLSFAIALVGQLMTLEAIVSCLRLVTITSTMTT